jgi:anaerobic selenocysteine-containing dehydrogenase
MEIEDRLTIDISPEDAAKRGIKTGDDVILRSRYGGPVEARANVSIIVPPGTIGGQYGWLGKGNTQRLVPRTHRDPESGYPCYFETPVSVVKKA